MLTLSVNGNAESLILHPGNTENVYMHVCILFISMFVSMGKMADSTVVI